MVRKLSREKLAGLKRLVYVGGLISFFLIIISVVLFLGSLNSLAGTDGVYSMNELKDLERNILDANTKRGIAATFAVSGAVIGVSCTIGWISLLNR